jgi:hypothetical protein
MHFCSDELMLILMAVPFVGGAWLWAHRLVERWLPSSRSNHRCEYAHSEVKDAHRMLGHLGETKSTCTIDRDQNRGVL